MLWSIWGEALNSKESYERLRVKIHIPTIGSRTGRKILLRRSSVPRALTSHTKGPVSKIDSEGSTRPVTSYSKNLNQPRSVEIQFLSYFCDQHRKGSSLVWHLRIFDFPPKSSENVLEKKSPIPWRVFASEWPPHHEMIVYWKWA